MTTVSLEVEMPDEQAQKLEQIVQVTGQDKNRLTQVALDGLIRLVESSFKARITAEQFRQIQEEFASYGEASDYADADDFLKRTA